MGFEQKEILLPGIVASILFVIAVVLISRRRRALWWIPSALLRAVALSIVVVLLARPFVQRDHAEPGTLLAAVDGSLSVHPAATEAAFATLQSLAPNAQRVIVGFSGVPFLTDAPRPDDGLSTVPEGALARLLLSPLADARSARLVLATDGLARVPWWPSSVSTPLRPLVASLRTDADPGVKVLQMSLATPPQIEKAFDVEVTVVAELAASGALTVELDGRVAREIPLTLEPGEARIPVSLPGVSAGTHRLVARLSVPNQEPLDDRAATSFTLNAAPRVLVLADRDDALIERALTAQHLNLETRLLSAFDPRALADFDVLVLDRVSSDALSTAPWMESLKAHLSRGRGLFVVPREIPGELHGREKRPFLDFLPAIGRPPPPPPPPEAKPPVDPPSEGLKPPDPEKRKKETKKAPSLGLILVIDASRSMEGDRIRLAKEAAIAAAEVLHPKDLVAVIAFNQQADVVLELTPAEDQAAIRRRIARIGAEGGTDYKPALELVRELFQGEVLGIKHAILLSDGESAPNAFSALVERMVAEGITLSTVGCGSGFDETLLSDLAAWGRGKYQPASSPNEVPQVFTIEVQRVIADSGARSRPDKHAQRNAAGPVKTDEPKPAAVKDPPKVSEEEEKKPPALPLRLALPAPYTNGLSIHRVPGVFGLHSVVPRPGSWVSIESESGDPVLLSGFAFGGRVMLATLPFEGEWARHLMVWDELSKLLAQAVRYLLPRGDQSRFEVVVEGEGRARTVTVRDRKRRVLDPSSVDITLTDELGAPLRCRFDALSQETFAFAADGTEDAAAVRVVVVSKDGDGEGEAFFALPPPPEIATRGVDLLGLTAWATALGGEVVPRLPATLEIPVRRFTTREPSLEDLLPWLLGILVTGLLLKRLFPGTAAPKRRQLVEDPDVHRSTF